MWKLFNKTKQKPNIPKEGTFYTHNKKGSA